jgi:2,3-dimethylmalate lyase
LFIKDQVFPKRCGHTPGKAVVPIEDMLAKFKAALDARQDRDLVIRRVGVALRKPSAKTTSTV